MRCSSLRALLSAKIRAIAPDAKASKRDVFKVVDFGYRELQGAPDRTCTLLLTVPPTRANKQLPQDMYNVTFALLIAYSDFTTVTDRIGDDGERISQALEAMPGENNEIIQIQVSGSGIEEIEGHIEASYSISVDYQLDSGV